MNIVPRTEWLRGKRGEWYVVVQVALILLVFIGPGTWGGWPTYPFPFTEASFIIGAALLLVGGVFFFAGIVKLGSNLTPLPHPRADTVLIEGGPYKFVRHPIYCGGIVSAFGWAFWTHGWLTLGYAILLLVFLDVKSRREERWLKERFPAYTAYQHRVRKLIPFIY